jgi:hypothetical protein
VRTAGVALFGWFIPGGAYLLRRRYLAFAVFCVLVCATFAAGIALQGASAWPQPADLAGLPGLDGLLLRAGAFAKLLAGAPYLLAQAAGPSEPFLTGRLHEAGTSLLTMAGLFNLLALAGAFESEAQ